jgi:membrane-bound metal-dependent hydrolase YbcI (DUF457 family)
VTLGIVIAAIGVGSAVLALWFHVRFPKLAPQEYRFAIFHLLGAHIVARSVVPGGMALFGGRPLIAVFAVAVPGLVYVFLSWLWLIRLAQQSFGGGFGSGHRQGT